MVASNHDVVEHSHVIEERQILKRSTDAKLAAIIGFQPDNALPLERDLPLAGLVTSGYAVEHWSFPSTVGAYDWEDLALANFERNFAQGVHTAKRQKNIINLD